MRLLLDTQVVLWLAKGASSRIPLSLQERLVSSEEDLLLSAVCVWEIALKRSLGKLPIEEDWRRWVLGLDARPLPVSFDHVAAVEELPHHHRDPFDRMLVAQAQVEGAALVTADRRLDAYDIETLWETA